jgi:hypothetical protein
MRNTAVDRGNTFHGATDVLVRGSNQADAHGRLAARVRKDRMQSAPEESFFVLSENDNTERNASLVAWRLLPDGDAGVRPPSCPPSCGAQREEAHVVQLATEPGLFHVARTSGGFLGAAATRDDSGAGGWCESHWATFSARGLPAAAGRPLKNPQGPITLKRFANGKYLLLFYFNSVPGYLARNCSRNPRNPYWLAAGLGEGRRRCAFRSPRWHCTTRRWACPREPGPATLTSLTTATPACSSPKPINRKRTCTPSTPPSSRSFFPRTR